MLEGFRDLPHFWWQGTGTLASTCKVKSNVSIYINWHTKIIPQKRFTLEIREVGFRAILQDLLRRRENVLPAQHVVVVGCWRIKRYQETFFKKLSHHATYCQEIPKKYTRIHTWLHPDCKPNGCSWWVQSQLTDSEINNIRIKTSNLPMFEIMINSELFIK